MTIGEVRSKLESNYEKHYENVKTNYYISIQKAIQYIQDQTGCESDIADKIVREWMCKKNIEYKNPNEITVECPYCHSTDTKKIGSGERAVSVLGLGLLSNKINKSFKCKNCGGTF